jgi:CubicO group peptidase (beta-lactamase class C family)
MKRTLRFFALSFLFDLLVGAVPASPTSSAASGNLETKIDRYLQPYVRLHAFSGVVFLARGDEPVFAKPYGMANYEFAVPNRLDTRFAIASITKRFTSVIIARLAQEKRLSGSDTLSKWVSDFPSADRITIAHLANHYSGVRDPEKLRRVIRLSRTPREVVDILKKEPLGSEPGATYSYTTANYAILAYVIEQVTGRSYADVVREYVYRPAGMSDSGELATTTVVPRLATGYMPDPFSDGVAVCGPEDPSWKLGGGSSYSTASDLHRFARALYGGKLLGSVRAVDHFRHSKMFEKTALGSSGSFPGAGAHLLVFPDDEVTVVVLSNNYATVTSAIAEHVAAMYFGREVPNAEVALAANPKPMDSKFVGEYGVDGRPWKFTLSLRDGRPVVAWTEIRKSALKRIDEDTWFSPLDWAKLTLRFREDGTFDGSFTLPGADPLAVKRR